MPAPEILITGGAGVLFLVGAYAYVYRWPHWVQEHLAVRELRRDLDRIL